jgi:PAB-dependent poly(A)-specific ribonuclease subunit 2
MSHDYRLMFPNSEDLDQVLATVAAESIRCMFCRNEIVRPGNAFVSELIYPAADPKQARRNPACRFSSILKASIERETQNRGWCSHCRRYQQVAIRKTVHRMPLVLMINAAINNPTYRQLWAIPGWLPEEVGILAEGGQVHCFEGEDLQGWLRNNDPGLTVYELVGLVAEINIVEQHKPHLVSFINVAVSAREADEQSRWHLFNDFLVTKVDRDEVFTFNQPWKLPCVLSYQVKNARHGVDDSWKDELDTTLLFYEWSMK